MSEITDTRSSDGADETEQDERRERNDDETADRWVGDDALETELPEDLQEALGEFLGTGGIETLDEWVEEIHERVEGEAVAVEDLCHVDEESPHWGEVNGERYYFRCFYDAVVLSALTDSPVEIRTETPTGETVEARADGTDELEVTPPDAVFSFGIEEGASETDADGEDEPSHEDMYAVVCPYVRAFVDREGYEQWNEKVDAVTVAAPLEGATELARRLVG